MAAGTAHLGYSLVGPRAGSTYFAVHKNGDNRMKARSICKENAIFYTKGVLVVKISWIPHIIGLDELRESQSLKALVRLEQRVADNYARRLEGIIDVSNGMISRLENELGEG